MIRLLLNNDTSSAEKKQGNYIWWTGRDGDGDSREVISRYLPGRTQEIHRKPRQDAAVNIRPAYAEYKSDA
jgi:hypothetical protein